MLRNPSPVDNFRGPDSCGRRTAPPYFLRTILLVPILAGLSGVLLHARWVEDQTGRRVDIPEHPQRLISLAPSITETLFALGLGESVVGNTDYCEYPPEAKLKPHVGPILNPNLERIVALKPDLVLGSPEANRRETWSTRRSSSPGNGKWLNLLGTGVLLNFPSIAPWRWRRKAAGLKG